MGMAKNESPKSSKTTRNKTKKSKHKKGKHSKSKSKSPISPPTPVTETPTPHPSRTPTPSHNLAAQSMLNKPMPIVKSVLPDGATPGIIDICEYYPHKLKRPSPKKKTVLKHQFHLKDIKIRNKRKSAVPRKGQQNDNKDPQRVEFSELSMIEIIRFLDENGMLDNESFMEIVDCPSPVWWEDAPGEDYCEEPIDRELVREALEGIRESPPPLEEDVQIRVQLLNKQLKNNDKLIKKKSKLEDILGNLKKKINKIKVENAKTDEMLNDNAKNDEIINDYSQNDAQDKGTDKTSESRHSECSDGDILSDISANEEELLKNLETIQIPIKNSSPLKETVKKDISTKQKPIIVPKTMPPLLKFPYQSANAEFSKLKCLTESLRSKNCTVTSVTASSETNSNIFTEASNDIPETSTINNSSETPKSTSESSKSISSSDDAASGDFDSISDTNVRFLDDDDVEMLTCGDLDTDEVDGPIIDETNTNDQEDTANIDKETDVNNELSEQISSWDNSDLVTVYSIVSPEPDTEQEITETRKPEEQNAKKARKVKTSFYKYRDAKMIAFLKQNQQFKKLFNRSERTTDKVSMNEHRPITDFISMPRSVASQRRLNVCNCGSVDCDCHLKRNCTFKSINGEYKEQKTYNSFAFKQNLG